MNHYAVEEVPLDYEVTNKGQLKKYLDDLKNNLCLKIENGLGEKWTTRDVAEGLKCLLNGRILEDFWDAPYFALEMLVGAFDGGWRGDKLILYLKKIMAVGFREERTGARAA